MDQADKCVEEKGEASFLFVESLCRLLFDEGFSEDEIILVLQCLDKANAIEVGV